MSRRGTRRSSFKIRRGSKMAGLIFWLKRFGIVLAAFVFTLWLGSWLWMSGNMTRAGDWVDNKTLHVTADMGFKVKNIMVEGRVHTDPDVLLAIINTEKGAPIFSFDPTAAKALIEKISWVKTVQVERRLPDTIFIGLQERKPLALWQHDKKIALIDREGQVLSDQKLSPFKDLIMVVGEGAPQQAYGLLEVLAAEPTIYERTESAIWIGARRWDLKLKGGTLVSLPEQDIGFALRRLTVAQEDEALLDKDITNVDLRESDRIIVRTRPGAVQEYKAGVKSGSNI